jgi:DNA (cytosine-5)-methyltransferase 1
VLLRRQRDGVLSLFPIWDDVKTFDGKPWRGKVDVISAGFPCQPFSLAGQRKGDADERNLWPDTIRIIREVRPRYCLLENVPGLRSHPYFGTILGDLAASGYDCRWDCIPASACGAPHQRDRLWIVAYPRGERRQQIARGAHGDEKENEGRASIQADKLDGNGQRDRAENVADANFPRLEGRDGGIMQKRSGERIAGASGPCGISYSDGEPENGVTESWSQCRDWSVEPDVGRVVNGCPFRVERLRALGNGQVPRVAEAAWSVLKLTIAKS